MVSKTYFTSEALQTQLQTELVEAEAPRCANRGPQSEGITAPTTIGGASSVGSMLGKHLLERVEHWGSFTVESPACTARAAVKLWLSLGFMGDSDLLESEIADDASYIGGRSVRLSFSWQRPETNPEARLAYLENVVRVHPEMATACERGMVAWTCHTSL